MLARRRIPLLLEGFGAHAVENQAEVLGVSPDEFVALAAHHHLRIAAAASSPGFLAEQPVESPRALTVALEPSCWSALESAAAGDGVTVAQLLARVALELAAALDRGRAYEWLGSELSRAEAA